MELAQPERFMRSVFSIFEKGGLDFVVMRQYEGYPLSWTKPDIGILVSSTHQKLLLDLFKLACNKLDGLFYFSLEYSNIISLYYIRLDSDPQKEVCWKVDARLYEPFPSTALLAAVPSWNYKVYYEDVNRRMCKQHGCHFPILDELDETLFLLKQLARKKEHHLLDKICEQMRNERISQWLCESSHMPHTEIEKILINPSSDSYLKLLNRCVDARWKRERRGAFIYKQAKGYQLFFNRRRISLPPTFYFSGPDGAGKTTAIAEVKEFLERRQIPYYTFYSYQKFLRHIGMRVRWLAKGAKTSFIEYQGNVCGHSDRNPGSWLWKEKKRLGLLFSWVDVWLGWGLALIFRLMGKTVLVEKSPYDLFIKYHMPYFPCLEKVLGKVLPQPSLGFLLCARADRIVQRKNELSVSEIENYYHRLERLFVMANEANYHAIDAESGVEQMSLELKQTVSQVLNERAYPS